MDTSWMSAQAPRTFWVVGLVVICRETCDLQSDLYVSVSLPGMGMEITRSVWVAVTSAQISRKIRTYICSILSSVFRTTPDHFRPVLVADVDGLAMQNMTDEEPAWLLLRRYSWDSNHFLFSLIFSLKIKLKKKNGREKKKGGVYIYYKEFVCWCIRQSAMCKVWILVKVLVWFEASEPLNLCSFLLISFSLFFFFFFCGGGGWSLLLRSCMLKNVFFFFFFSFLLELVCSYARFLCLIVVVVVVVVGVSRTCDNWYALDWITFFSKRFNLGELVLSLWLCVPSIQL